MRSLQLSNMRRLFSRTSCIRPAPSTKITLPASFSCRVQAPISFSTSFLPRTALGFQRQTFQSNAYSTYNSDDSRGSSIKTFPPSPVLYISNLPWSATPNDLRLALEEYGELTKITFGLTSDGRSRGFAHVEFSGVEDAAAVLNAHRDSPFMFAERTLNMAYGSRTRKVGPPQRIAKEEEPTRCLFIGSIVYEATEEDIQNAFDQFGRILSIRIGRDDSLNSRGFAHVDFESVEDVQRVLDHYQSNPIKILDRDVRIDRAVMPTSMHPPSSRLYFKGFLGTVDQLLDGFGEYGHDVIDVLFMKDSVTYEPFGTGFIQFKTEPVATAALNALNGKALVDGIRFELAYAKPRPVPDDNADKISKRKFARKHGRSSGKGSSNAGNGEYARRSYGTEWRDQ